MNERQADQWLRAECARFAALSPKQRIAELEAIIGPSVGQAVLAAVSDSVRDAAWPETGRGMRLRAPS